VNGPPIIPTRILELIPMVFWVLDAGNHILSLEGRCYSLQKTIKVTDDVMRVREDLKT